MYDTEIAKQAEYIDKAAKATLVDKNSSVEAQKAVYDERELANTANEAVK